MLDDSTDRTTRDLVDDKVVEWRERGVNIEVMRRTNRAGYKAGALKEVYKSLSLHSLVIALLTGIGCPAASTDVISAAQGLERLAEYDYVAIFDADFKPDSDFLVSDIRFACTDILLHTCGVLSSTRWYCFCLQRLLRLPEKNST